MNIAVNNTSAHGMVIFGAAAGWPQTVSLKKHESRADTRFFRMRAYALIPSTWTECRNSFFRDCGRILISKLIGFSSSGDNLRAFILVNLLSGPTIKMMTSFEKYLRTFHYPTPRARQSDLNIPCLVNISIINSLATSASPSSQPSPS